MGLIWLTSFLRCDGAIVAQPIVPDQVTEKDLAEVCFKMILVSETIEEERCGGVFERWGIFEEIDQLEDQLRHNPGEVVVDDVVDLCDRVGKYYRLAGGGTIDIDPRVYRQTKIRFDSCAKERKGD